MLALDSGDCQSDPLAGDWRRPRVAEVATVPAELGLVVEDRETGWTGAVLRVEPIGGSQVVVLEDRHGRVRSFPLGPGFLIDGRPVVLTRANAATAAAGPVRSASGSRAVVGAKARVAAASRLFVEGTHDAELVEKVWGHDLRVEGVVVEVLHGVDDLAAALADFGPTRTARAGVLVDHLVPGSKESRIVAAASARFPDDTVLVVGHPYVDVWQAVRLADHLPGRRVEGGDRRRAGAPPYDDRGSGVGVETDPRARADVCRSGARLLRSRRGVDRLRDGPPSGPTLTAPGKGAAYP